jgi:hypothetical protein
MSEIDELKLANFQAMTDCNDRLTAIRLLESSNWDEMAAANEYMLNNAMAMDEP